MDIQSLFSNEKFVKELLTKQTAEEAQDFICENGYNISLEEVKMIGEGLRRLSSGELSLDYLNKAVNGELSEDELEDVAGGFALSTLCVVAFIGGVVGGGGAVFAVFQWGW